jgi:hypothetical protein
LQYAKDEDSPDNVYIRITTYNRGPDPATLHVIPQLWFPNTWSWPLEKPPMPILKGSFTKSDISRISVKHPSLGKTNLYCMPSPPPVDGAGNFDDPDADAVEPELLFTENNTNYQRLYQGNNDVPYVKDAFHDHIIPSHRPSTVKASTPETPDSGQSTPKLDSAKPNGTINKIQAPSVSNASPVGRDFVNPEKVGTKSAAHYIFHDVPGHGGCAVVRLKLTPLSSSKDPSIEDEGIFDDVVEERRKEADEFYNALALGPISDDLKQIMRQALGGMLWTKQYYKFIQKEWIEGDPAQPRPPPERKYIRNREWRHMHIADILSMPDKYVLASYQSVVMVLIIPCADGSTRSLLRGTPRSTASLLLLSTRLLRRNSSTCSPGSGT